MDKIAPIPRKITVQYELVLSSVMVNTVIFRKVFAFHSSFVIPNPIKASDHDFTKIGPSWALGSRARYPFK